MKRRLLFSAVVLGVASLVHGELVNVRVDGVVDFNVIGGSMGGPAGTPSGTPVSMSFNLNSDDFINSGSFPTRGYPLLLDTFSMKVGGVQVPIVNPQPETPAVFVLRNNDPAVDGFFLSAPSVDFPFPVAVTIPGLVPQHELDFSVSYTDSNTLSSLNLLDAVGTYTMANLNSFDWSIGRFGNDGAFYVFDTIVISVVPEPATGMLALPVLAALGMRRRK